LIGPALRRLSPLCLLLPGLVGAQPATDAEVDRYVQGELAARKIPGLALAVMREGRIVLARGYGYANLEHRVPVTAETIFQSGSVGKQFTATLIMMLVEAGRLGLDDPIGRHLPGVPEAWSGMTVRHLLTHTSGLGDYPDGFDFRRDYTEDDLFQVITASRLEFAPGEKWRYSNLAYVTLGILIHKVSGKFYGDLLQERIFGPLDMTTTRVISEAELVPNRAAGYVIRDGKLQNQSWVSPSLNTTADGALYFSVLDLAKWDAALYGEGLLGRASLERMWTPVALNDGKTHPYGFGWGVGSVNGRRVVQHGGGWQGFLTHIARYLDDRLTVVVLTNLGSPETRPGEIAQQVAALYVPELRAAAKE
jgi:CubicO group peptidase (beta-lactamase class C family)